MNSRVCSFVALSLLLGGSASLANVNPEPADAPLYLLTYDHGGLVLWGRDHFVKYLHSAVDWLDRYPGFKIGLDNEAYTYDKLAEQDPAVKAGRLAVEVLAWWVEKGVLSLRAAK